MSLPPHPPAAPPVEDTTAEAERLEVRPDGLPALHTPEAWRPALSPLTWRSCRLNILLFVLTTGTVYLAGGPRLVVGIMSILLAHEMGHYLACRYYGVDATLPFLIPAPPWLVGTFGALIRIKAPIPHRRALFDIGIAGPLAGFLVCLPVLFAGVWEAELVPREPHAHGLYMGEPLLFQWAASALRGTIPSTMDLSLGPLGLAAWFGLFVTALNMMPIGQLDGGHVMYSLLRRRAWIVSRAAFGVCLVLLYLRPTWLLWSVLMLVVGRPHPPTLDDEEPLGRGRALLGALGFAVFAVCFTPNPILVSWSEFLGGFREILGR